MSRNSLLNVSAILQLGILMHNWNGRVLWQVNGLDETLYLYGQEAMFEVFAQEENGHSGFWKDWWDKRKAPLPIDDSLSDDGEDGFCTLWSRLGFVPNLALIYSAVWSRLKILLLGSPWTEEPTYNKTVPLNAFGDGISVCFVKSSMGVYFCVSLTLESSPYLVMLKLLLFLLWYLM